MPLVFPLTVSVLKARWESLNFPCVLSDEQWAEIVDEAMLKLQDYFPVNGIAVFQTVADVQNYKVFDPDDPVLQGLLQNALSIDNVYWSPGGDWSSLNLFSPGWQLLSSVMTFTGSYFHQPSQMIILRQKIDAWRKQFGAQGFQILGMFGEPDAELQIFPIPLESGTNVVVEYSRKYVLEDIGQKAYRYLKQWIDYYSATAAANFYYQTAGIVVLDFADSKATAAYWERKAKEFLKIAEDVQGGMNQGIAERS